MMISTPKSESSVDIRRTMLVVVTIGGIAALVTAFVAGAKPALSVVLGAALGAGNLWAVARLVRGFLATQGPKASWTAFALVKFSALFGVVMVLLVSGIAELMPLVIGYGSLPLGIVGKQLFLAPGASGG